MSAPLLVVLGGLPGTGKTSIARGVAAALDATFLRIDTIEAAVRRSGLSVGGAPSGYTVAQAVAADQLRAGRRVVADAVNPVRIAREGWRATAEECGAELRLVRVTMSDVDEHRRRVEARASDIEGLVVPTWAQVSAEQHDRWTEPHLELDNNSSLDDAVSTVLAELRPASPAARLARGLVRLGTADAGEVLTLQLATWLREAHENDTLAIPALHESLADVVGQLADPAVTAWGLRERGRLLAMVRVSRSGPTTAYLGRLGVAPDHYGAGLGAALLAHAERHRPEGTSSIELITGARSAVNHGFYGRRGYRVVERHDDEGWLLMRKDGLG